MTLKYRNPYNSRHLLTITQLIVCSLCSMHNFVNIANSQFPLPRKTCQRRLELYLEFTFKLFRYLNTLHLLIIWDICKFSSASRISRWRGYRATRRSSEMQVKVKWTVMSLVTSIQAIAPILIVFQLKLLFDQVLDLSRSGHFPDLSSVEAATDSLIRVKLVEIVIWKDYNGNFKLVVIIVLVNICGTI